MSEFLYLGLPVAQTGAKGRRGEGGISTLFSPVIPIRRAQGVIPHFQAPGELLPEPSVDHSILLAPAWRCVPISGPGGHVDLFRDRVEVLVIGAHVVGEGLQETTPANEAVVVTGLWNGPQESGKSLNFSIAKGPTEDIAFPLCPSGPAAATNDRGQSWPFELFRDPCS